HAPAPDLPSFPTRRSSDLPGFTPGFLKRLTDAGASIHSFDPRPTLFRIRTNILCRLHRKIVIIDGEVAFVGGINFTEEHVRSFGDRKSTRLNSSHVKISYA